MTTSSAQILPTNQNYQLKITHLQKLSNSFWGQNCGTEKKLQLKAIANDNSGDQSNFQLSPSSVLEALLEISIQNINCQYIDTFEKYRYQY